MDSLRALVRIAALVLLALPGYACLVVSLSPLDEDAALETDRALIGTWEDADDRIALDVTASEWNTYAIVWSAPGIRYEARARVTRIGGELFADVAVPPGTDHGPFLVPVHGICRVRVLQDGALQIAPLDYDVLSAPPPSVALPGPRLDVRDRLLLTGSTAALRRWLARHAARDDVFAPALTFTRRSALP